MTELEAATIAYQNSSLAVQQTSLEISRAGLWAVYAQTGVALFVGLLQVGLIYGGIRLMRRSADHRDKQHEATMAALQEQREDAKAQHVETMRALEALIERTAPKGRP